MRRFLRQMLANVRRGEDVELLIALALAIVVSVLHLLHVADEELVASLTLALLGLIALGLLITRYRLGEIHHDVDVPNRVHFSTSVPDSLDDHLARAREVWMLGLILRGTTTASFYRFQEKARQGGTIRALIVDPHKVNLNELVERFSRVSTVDQFRSDLEQTINQYREIARNAGDPENVQLRLLGFVPPFSLYVFPGYVDGGVIYAEIYCYKSVLGSVPKFRIAEHENPAWYKHFTSQFSQMWDAAEASPLQ